MLRPGLAFFTPDNPDLKVGRHLWFILSEPSQGAQVVIANLSTFKEEYAHLGCAVESNEHDSLSRRSLLRCDEARLSPTASLAELIRARKLQETKSASPALLAKLRAALCASPHTSNEVKSLLASQGICEKGNE